MGERVTFVIPKEMKKALEGLQRLTGKDRSTFLRMLIDKGLVGT